jgi:hypothetical protein
MPMTQEASGDPDKWGSYHGATSHLAGLQLRSRGVGTSAKEVPCPTVK